MTASSGRRIHPPPCARWTAIDVFGYDGGVKDRDGALAYAPVSLSEPRDGRAAGDPSDLLSRGDRRGAVSLLMDLHGDAVFGFCIRALRDRTLAEDILQQVFLEAYRDIDRFRGQSSLRTWLLRIASHRCHDAIRARNRRDRIVDPHEEVEGPDPATPIAQRLERSELVAALEDCLTGLSDEVRMTVLLRFQSELTYDEMASAIGVRSDALQARVARALPALRRCLESKGWSRV